MKTGRKFVFEGLVHGEIVLEKEGIEGFGYDPIFQPNGFKRNFCSNVLISKKRNLS